MQVIAIEAIEIEMETKVVLEKQDLTHLKWAHAKYSGGTAGTFLKSESTLDSRKIYYKLSCFDIERGITGHECVNEIIVDRLLTLFQIEHLHYQLIYADIEYEGKIYTTHLCATEDFKKRGESKCPLDDYYKINAADGESRLDFCRRMGFGKNIDEMLLVDYLIANRDRHGANIEILRNSREKTLRIAPLFDHGLSLLFSCRTDIDAKKFDALKDITCNNFIGGVSCLDNLKLISEKKDKYKLKAEDKDFIFADLDTVLSKAFRDKIWKMLTKRLEIYESI